MPEETWEKVKAIIQSELCDKGIYMICLIFMGKTERKNIVDGN